MSVSVTRRSSASGCRTRTWGPDASPSAVGAVTITVHHRYPLREAAEVHRAIEERRTTGSTVLLPWA